MQSITEQWVKENKDKRFTFEFDNGTILKNVKVFIGQYGGIGYLQGRAKRMGRHFPIYDTIKSITETTKEKKVYSDIENAKTILKKIHKNSWIDLQKEMQDVIKGLEVQDTFKWHFSGKLKFRNISSLLNDWEKKRLIEAFENKNEWRWSKAGRGNNGRDLSLSTQLDKDGNLRAFFSSEYVGCGNGDYWLLLNPTTAIYYERD